MKNILLFGFIIASASLKAQINSDIKGEFDKIKTQISAIQADVQSVKSQNIYLKKVLDINTPILKVEADHTAFTITKVSGSKEDKTISIELLIESKNFAKSADLQDFTIVDLEGNQYDLNYDKSSYRYPKLSTNIPIKLNFLFSKISGEPQIIKLLRFSNSNTIQNSYEKSRSTIEFRDLNVTWQ